MSTPDAADTSEEEILRKKLKPDPTVDQVIDAVRTHFYDGSQSVRIQLIKELDSYDDKNLWITVDGTNYLAKVHNGVESRDLIQYLGGDNASNDACETGDCRKAAIHLQHSIMTHLNASGISTNEPQIPTTLPTGKPNVTPVAVVSLPVHSKEDSPTPLVLRLLGWVAGRPMSACKMLPIEALADAGRFLGRLGKAFTELPDADALAAAKRYHQWDGKNTTDLKDFVQYVTDDTRRSMVESVISSFQTDILDKISSGEKEYATSLIHADFNDANFLLDEDYCVSGVIDFGDSVERYETERVVQHWFLCLLDFVCVLCSGKLVHPSFRFRFWRFRFGKFECRPIVKKMSEAFVLFPTVMDASKPNIEPYQTPD